MISDNLHVMKNRSTASLCQFVRAPVLRYKDFVVVLCSRLIAANVVLFLGTACCCFIFIG